MEALSQIERGTALKLTPHIEGFILNPSTPIEVVWYEDIQEVSFRLQAESRLAGHSIPGFIEVEAGPISIAYIPLNIRVRATGEPEEVAATATSTTQSYSKIFCSYSYKNRDIVEACKTAYEALAISVYLDKYSLKSGEAWNPALHHLIQDSDLFQLYWSTASRQSSNVEDEWRYALSIVGQKGEQFIRPVRWEEPLPPLPPELAHIHVAWLDIDALARLTGRSINPTQPDGTPTVLTQRQASACRSVNRHYEGIRERAQTVREAYRFFSKTQEDIYSDQCRLMINPVLKLSKPIQNFNAFLDNAHLPTSVYQLRAQLKETLNRIEVLLKELALLKTNCCPNSLKTPIKQRQDMQQRLKGLASSLEKVSNLMRSFKSRVSLLESEDQSERVTLNNPLASV
jgi:hypothetical protein